MIERAPRRTGWFATPVALTVGAIIAGALFVLLFPWFPGDARLAEGDAASWTLTAPRDLEYESVVLTEEARDAAAGAVVDVERRDDAIPTRQLEELDRQLAEIEAVRGRTLSDSARESEIRAISGVSLSPESAATFAAASDAEFQALADEARDALGRVLAGSISEDEVEASQARAAALLSPLLDADETAALEELINPLVVPTVIVDQQLTEEKRAEARAAVPPVTVTRARGEVLVEDGQRLTAADVELLDEAELGGGVRAAQVGATLLMALLAGAAAGGYLRVAQPAALAGVRRVTLFVLLLVVPVAALKFTLPLLFPDADRHFVAYALPIAAAPIAAVVLLDLGVALLLTLLLAVIGAYISAYVPLANAVGGGQLETVRMLLAISSTSLTGVYVASRAANLSRYLAAGMASGVAGLGALGAVWLLDPGRGITDVAWMLGVAATSGMTSALIGVGFFVLLSRPFGIITRVELMELAQLSHPLLRRLQDEAPGTFQHSIMVGNAAERAADLIGADPLLVRVGAYYHDVGKLTNPSFFVENVEGDADPHASLDPLQSTRLIHQHVLAGMDIARRYHLPDAIVQFIPQHHGTRRVQFFYRRAAAQDPDVDPDLFRYPGPTPQSRETALVMLADSCEATVRASGDRSRERIREIVDAVVRERIEEGQFDDCDITLRDLDIAAASLAQTLTAMYHPRVEYPEPTEHELRERGVEPLPERPVLETVGRVIDPDEAADEA